MKEQNGDRLNALPDELRDRRTHLAFIECDQDLAARVHALMHLPAQRTLDQRLVLAKEQVVGIRPIDAADLIYITESARRDQRASRTRALKDRVDHDGGAMEEEMRCAERNAGLCNARCNPCHETLRRAKD